MLFKHNLTPQRQCLLQEVRLGIHKQSLRTSDLQLCLLHFREAKLNHQCWELGSSIAHVKRDKGDVWKRALIVWATHMYYEYLNPDKPRLTPLPYDVFETIIGLIQREDEMQLRRDLKDLFPDGVTKEEILATFDHLYWQPKKEKRRNKKYEDEQDGFVSLASSRGNEPEDVELVKRMILRCEKKALNIPPSPLKDLVDAIESAFAVTDPSHRPFSIEEQNYLQLHLLVSLHNLLFDINAKEFKAITGRKLPVAQSMLTVSAMDSTLALAVDFFYLQNGLQLETLDFACHQYQSYYSLFSTNLKCSEYLLEGDSNIRSSLYNHPLEVRIHRGKPVIIALDKQRGRFKPTRSRLEVMSPEWC